MPSAGFYLFLPRCLFQRASRLEVCQCPQRASTYFFKKHCMVLLISLVVSMPSTGFYLFLQLQEFQFKCEAVCQCPQRASTYFFIIRDQWQMLYTSVCQCPQRASTYFFGTTAFVKESIVFNVSMPSTGFYLFLPTSRLHMGMRIGLCQCPQRASTYFFEPDVWARRRFRICVNALNGLLLISSTVESFNEVET